MESMSTKQEVEVEKLYREALAGGKLRNCVWNLVKAQGDIKAMQKMMEEVVLIAYKIYGDHGVNVDDMIALIAEVHPHILSAAFDRKVRAVK